MMLLLDMAGNTVVAILVMCRLFMESPLIQISHFLIAMSLVARNTILVS